MAAISKLVTRPAPCRRDTQSSAATGQMRRNWFQSMGRCRKSWQSHFGREASDSPAAEKRPVTPGAIVPAREQLGDLLLETNHPPEAIKEFERALTMTPQRRGASMGLAHAREMIASAEPNKN